MWIFRSVVCPRYRLALSDTNISFHEIPSGIALVTAHLDCSHFQSQHIFCSFLFTTNLALYFLIHLHFNLSLSFNYCTTCCSDHQQELLSPRASSCCLSEIRDHIHLPTRLIGGEPSVSQLNIRQLETPGLTCLLPNCYLLPTFLGVTNTNTSSSQL